MTREAPPREHLWSRPADLRLFVTSTKPQRSRRPGDVLLLGVSVLLLALLAWVANPQSGFEGRLQGFLESFPHFTNVLWRLGMGVLTLWAGFLLAASLVRGRLDLLRDQLLAMAAAALGATLLDAAIGGDSGSMWGSAFALGPPPDRVSLRLAFATAAIGTALPHLIRPFRRLSRWLIVIGALSTALGSAATPNGVVTGFLCGLASAAAVHLALGSSGGWPSLEEVEKGLADVGVVVGSLSEAQVQHAGVFHLQGLDTEGRALDIRLYGRDAWDAQLMAKAWRALWFRDAESLSLTRLQQAEHEGFVTLLAAERGVATPEVVQAGRTADNDALIVLRRPGQTLAELTLAEAAPPSDEVLDAVWDSVLAFSDAGFAHGDLCPGNLRVDGARVVIDGLSGAVVASSRDQRLVDVAQAVVLTAILVGPERSLDAAQRRLRHDELVEVIPYLQPAALGPGLRDSVKAAHLDVDGLRNAAAGRAAIEPPEMAKLRRVTPRSIVRALLLVAVAYFIISTLAGVNLSEIVDALQGASKPIMLMALLVAQLPRFSQAESTRAACPRPIAYGPVALLQFAMTFIGLVLPSTVARVALNVRFFQRQGIAPASALSIGVIDTGAGLVVQALILLMVVLFGLGDVNIDLGQGSGESTGKILWIIVVVVALAVLALILAVVIPRLRRRVLDRVKPWADDARETLINLRSPSKVIRLLLANLVSELLFAASLAIVLLSLGSPLPFSEVLVINVTVSLFAGLIPVPGGIGVYEAAFVVALTAAGIDDSTAFAAAISFRLCTYYLPPIWGYPCLHRLEKSGYV
jgi:uncharacterized protein (TIRG00374 family)